MSLLRMQRGSREATEEAQDSAFQIGRRFTQTNEVPLLFSCSLSTNDQVVSVSVIIDYVNRAFLFTLSDQERRVYPGFQSTNVISKPAGKERCDWYYVAVA
jgi:hypothetical protein